MLSYISTIHLLPQIIISIVLRAHACIAQCMVGKNHHIVPTWHTKILFPFTLPKSKPQANYFMWYCLYCCLPCCSLMFAMFYIDVSGNITSVYLMQLQFEPARQVSKETSQSVTYITYLSLVNLWLTGTLHLDLLHAAYFIQFFICFINF